MGTMTPAQRRALYESARFARETTYNGPLGPEYMLLGFHKPLIYMPVLY